MSRPFFSVIMTVYNRAGLMRFALESLRRQTFGDFEVFLADDGSSDNPAGVFESFRRTGWNFVRFDENHGYPYCKNRILDKVSGDYVTFLDSDDVWLPDRLARFRAHAIALPGDGFIFSDCFLQQHGRVLATMSGGRRDIPRGRLGAWAAVSNRWLPYVTTNVALKREAVKDAGYYNEKLVHLADTEYFARIVGKYPVGYIPEPLAVYRIHEISLTSNWDSCLAENMRIIDMTAPPPDVEIPLKDHVLYAQAVVYFKRGMGRAARECLGQIKNSPVRARILYPLTFVPEFFLKIPRALYKKLRVARLMFMPVAKKLRDAENWLADLERASTPPTETSVNRGHS